MKAQIPELDDKGLRQFGISTGAVIAILFGLLLPWIWDFGFVLWPWIVFAVLAGAGLVVPKLLRPVYRVWMRFGLLLSRVTTPIILGLVFFGIVLPIAIIMKIIRRDPLARDLEVDVATYRIKSESTSKDNLERPF